MSEISAIYGVVSQVRDYPTQQVTKIVVEIPIEFHVAATQLVHGQRVLLTLAPEELATHPFGLCVNGEPPEERPEAPTKTASKKGGGPLSNLAGVWCKSPQFQRWARDHFPEVAKALPDAMPGEQVAREVILTVCFINSRARLDDEDGLARAHFNAKIRGPYMADFPEAGA